MEKLLKEDEVAATLGLSVSTLQKWRCRKCGPPFWKMGVKCVRYPESGLREWVLTRNGTNAEGDPDAR